MQLNNVTKSRFKNVNKQFSEISLSSYWNGNHCQNDVSKNIQQKLQDFSGEKNMTQTNITLLEQSNKDY